MSLRRAHATPVVPPAISQHRLVLRNHFALLEIPRIRLPQADSLSSEPQPPKNERNGRFKTKENNFMHSDCTSFVRWAEASAFYSALLHHRTKDLLALCRYDVSAILREI